MISKLLTTKEVANALGCSTHHVLHLRQHGVITGTRFGKRWMYSEEDINRFISRNNGKDFSNILSMSPTYIKKNYNI